MQPESSATCCKWGIKWSWTWYFNLTSRKKRARRENYSLTIPHTKKEKKQTLDIVPTSLFSISHRRTTWEMSFLEAVGVMKRCTPPRDRNRMEINTFFVMRQNRFWHLAEGHAGQLLQMALAHINIPAQQRRREQAGGESVQMKLFVLG